MSNSISHPDFNLADADTVVIVVHGVGDHSDVKITEAGRAGFGATGSKGETRTVTISGLDLPGKSTSSPVEALVVELNGKSHIIIPVAWSGIRERSGRWADKLPASVGFQIFAVALPILFTIPWGLLRTVPRAQGVWKLAVFLAAMSVAAAIAVIGLGGFSIAVSAPWWFGGPGNWSAPAAVLAPLLVLAALGFFIKLITRLLDFAGDVAGYVGRSSTRDEMAKTLNGICDRVGQHAANARILVVGHSLGSVVVTHWAALLEKSHPLSGRLLLLTMGSPLRLMSRVYKGTVLTPDELLDAYRRNAVPLFWANLWRDGDLIGRMLRPENSLGFKEASIGPGGHSNYWKDPALWRTVYSLLQRNGLDEIQSALASAFEAPLADKEERELGWRIKEMKILQWYTGVPIFLGLTFMPRGGIVSSLKALPEWGGRTLVGGTWLLGVLLTIVVFVFIDRSLAARAKREWLGVLRLRLNPARMLAVLAIGVVGLAHYFYRLFDTMPPH